MLGCWLNCVITTAICNDLPCDRTRPGSGCTPVVILCSVPPASPPAKVGCWGRCPEWWASWHPGPFDGTLTSSYTDASSKSQCRQRGQRKMMVPNPSLGRAVKVAEQTLTSGFQMCRSKKCWITDRGHVCCGVCSTGSRPAKNKTTCYM